jgi:ABC-type uncharacterized transport system fused permease/ATPase subunit
LLGLDCFIAFAPRNDGAAVRRGPTSFNFPRRALVGQQMRAVIVSQGHAQLVGVVPLLLCTPKFLDRSMSLGQMMQVASAFSIVQGAMSWLVDNYPRIAEWMASLRRVADLLAAIDGLDKLERMRPARIFGEPAAAALDLNALSVLLADGAPLVDSITARVKLGEKVLLVGESGTGKSALVRALAGGVALEPWGGGASPVGGRLRDPAASLCAGWVVTPSCDLSSASGMCRQRPGRRRTHGRGARPVPAEAR